MTTELIDFAEEKRRKSLLACFLNLKLRKGKMVRNMFFCWLVIVQLIPRCLIFVDDILFIELGGIAVSTF